VTKKSRPAQGAPESEADTAQGADAEPVQGSSPDVLGDFAEDLGKLLGSVQNRATTWIQQRKDITDQLTQIRDTANQYLQQLGAEGAHLVQRFQKARRGPGAAASASAPPPAGSSEAPAPGPTTQKRTMSAEARARIAEAQRRRWAKLRRKKG
jgi:hypothetical protein